MKNNLKSSITAMTLFFLAIPVQLIAQDQQEQKNEHVRYTITDLGLAADQAGGINNKGWLDFTRILADGSIHATLRREGVATDLGTLEGPNSSAFFGPSERGQVVGKAEKSTPDPLGEDSCFYGTHLLCLGFVWQNGVMTPLATLGGNNSQANNINNRGHVVGQAENTTPDPTCPPPQVLQNKPVIWEGGEIQELPTVPGDPDGVALRINDKGQVVGASANCSIPFHAVLWQLNRHDEEKARRFDADDWTVTDLGNLGGTMNNVAQGINNRGQVVGGSDLTGDATGHAFLWTEDNGMQDLDTLPGDFGSYAFSINDKGQVVGLSGDVNGNRAFLWQDGVMTDLNKVIPPSFPFVLIEAFDINARGEIVGLAIDPNKGETHGFLLTPCDEEHANQEGCEDHADAIVSQGETRQTPKVTLPENVRKMLGQRMGSRYHTPGLAPAESGTAGEATTEQPLSCAASDDLADDLPGNVTPASFLAGACQVSRNELTGVCLRPESLHCLGKYDPTHCPPGHAASKRIGMINCIRTPNKVDLSRTCIAH